WAREWMTQSFPGAKLFDNRVQSLKGLLTRRRHVDRPRWFPISTAPKDGTLCLLLISPYEREKALEDTEACSISIGFNNLENDGEDCWKFAGWCWSHDHFTEGEGTPFAWMLAPAERGLPE